MDHLDPFQARAVQPLPLVESQGWQLKQYAILSPGRTFDAAIAAAAGAEAIKRLPTPGSLADAAGNHGVGVQIVHFAQVAVVAPVFYWQWGSVLAEIDQMRASWEAPCTFGDGMPEVLGCVWEMDVVNFEVQTWKTTLMGSAGTPQDRLTAYLTQSYALNVD